MAKKAKAKAKKFDVQGFRSFTDTKIVKVDTHEWKDFGDLYVRTMSGQARDAYEASIYFAGKKAKATGRGTEADGMRTNIVIATACDKDGNLLFKPEHAEWLCHKSAAVLDRIQDKARELAGMSAEDIDEMEKHLGSAQS